MVLIWTGSTRPLLIGWILQLRRDFQSKYLCRDGQWADKDNFASLVAELAEAFKTVDKVG